MTPYRPPVLLPQSPSPSTVAILYYRREEAVIVSPRSEQCTLVLFISRKIGPSPVAYRLYTLAPCCSQMNPGVHITALVLFRFVFKPTLSNMLTIFSDLPAPRSDLALLSFRHLHRSIYCVPPPTTQNRVEGWWCIRRCGFRWW